MLELGGGQKYMARESGDEKKEKKEIQARA